MKIKIGPDQNKENQTMENPEPLQPKTIRKAGAIGASFSRRQVKADHFDSLIAGPDIGATGQIVITAIGQEDFFKLFVTGFQISSHVTNCKASWSSRKTGGPEMLRRAFDCIVDIPRCIFF